MDRPRIRPPARRLDATAWTYVAQPERPCPRCGHTLGPHTWYATDTDPSEDLPCAGGVLVCPAEGCAGCGLPWGSATEPGAFVPDAGQIAARGPVLATMVVWSRPGQ